MNHGAAASKTKGDNYLSIKNSESLDNYIQNTLASLYPPFEATAATVLWQLFSIVEKYYNGDGLRCLIDFLVPAKRLLQSIQQETCSGYTGLIFCHEGWPLCIHEKVVVQLASLRKVRLKPGDFYFQIVPVEKQSANLVLKCLSRNGQGIEEFIVPETMYGYIFTAEFLENVNCEWDASPLQNCLLTTGPATYRTPWKNIVNPIFVPTAESILQKYPDSCLLERLLNSSPDPKAMTQTMESNSLHESSTSNDTCSTVIEVTFGNSCENQDNGDSGLCQGPQSQAEKPCLQTLAVVEGADVLNSRPHPDGCLKKGSVTEGVIHEPEKRLELTPEYSKEDASLSPLVKGNGTKSIAFGTNLSSPCQKRRESLYFETKRLFRNSYIEALQNPMTLGSSSEESIAEEDPSDHVIHSGQVDGNSKITDKMHKYHVQQGSFWTARLSKQEDTNEAARLGEASQTSGKLPVSQIISPIEVCRESSDRTQSSNKSCMSSQNKDCKPSVSPCGSNANSPKIVNGNLARLKKPDSHIHEFITTKNKKDEDSRDSRTDFQDGEFKVTCWHENELLSTNHGDPDHLIPSQLFEVNQELLQSGVISLCGNRDRAGRAIVQVCMKNTAWLGEHSRVNELTQLLAYFYSIPRKDVRALGLLVLVDIRKSQTVSVLFKALSALQTAVPHCIHSALILVEKESSFRPDKEIPFQVKQIKVN